MWVINGFTYDLPEWKDPETNPQHLLQQLYDMNSGVVAGRTYTAKFIIKQGRKTVVLKEVFVAV